MHPGSNVSNGDYFLVVISRVYMIEQGIQTDNLIAIKVEGKVLVNPYAIGEYMYSISLDQPDHLPLNTHVIMHIKIVPIKALAKQS